VLITFLMIPSPTHQEMAHMEKPWISSGSSYEDQIGYLRAVVVDNWVFVSGTTGFDYASMTIADDVATQAEQCLKNIAASLAQAD
jgi:enamine deaminase RidA (YjgF/YER057c/UK114 family)